MKPIKLTKTYYYEIDARAFNHYIDEVMKEAIVNIDIYRPEEDKDTMDIAEYVMGFINADDFELDFPLYFEDEFYGLCYQNIKYKLSEEWKSLGDE